MTTYGVTPEGFVKRTLADILVQYSTDEIAEMSTSLDTSSSSPMGQLNAVIAKTAAEIWDLAEIVYRSEDPDSNGGDAQDAVCAITGTTRKPASKSQVAIALGLNASTTVPVGSMVSVAGNPAVRFKLVGPEPAVGQPVVGGPVTSTTAGSYIARFEAESTGPIAANAGTLSVIVTPVTGWNSATNALDALKGENKEADSLLRARREDELAAAGSSPVDAVRAELLKLDGMQQVTIFENYGDATDGNGVPGHSLECLCYDGPGEDVADNVIAQRIWDSRAGGIRPFGSLSGNAVDAEGVTRVVPFSRPTQKPVYFTITISVDAETFPSSGDADIKAAIVAKGQPSRAGADVILASFYSSIFGIAGVTDISLFKAGFTASPSGTANLAIAPREKATYDTSRIVIIHA